MSASGDGAVGVGGDLGYAVTGDGGRVDHVEHHVTNRAVGRIVVQAGELNVRQEASSGPVEWPVLVGRIPNLAGWHQDRPEATLLETALADGEGAVLGQVITGTGGVGKTQLAAQYAQSAWERALADPVGRSWGRRQARLGGRRGHGPRAAVDLVVWAPAAERTALVEAYARAARTVLPDRLGSVEPEAAAELFLTWLRRTARCWLVVLDDVASPSALTGLWPPEVVRGRTVVTTRSRAAAWTTATRAQLPLGVYRPEQSLAYLRQAVNRPERHGRNAGDGDGSLDALAVDLGHLPIALAQAAAYLVDTGRTVERYRELLADRAYRLRQAMPDDASLPDQQLRTVAALWDVSVERADAHPPAGLARPLLELAAVLGAEAVPDVVLTGSAARAHLAERTGAAEVDRLAAEDALRALDRLNLLDHDPGPDGSFRIHRLVRRAVRESESFTAHAPATERAAADALLEVWPPEDHLDRVRADALRGTAETLLATVADRLWDPVTGIHPVLLRAGRSVFEAGQREGAVQYWLQLVATSFRLLGPDHADSLTARHELALAYAEAGRTAQAVHLGERVLADRERLLGSDDPATGTTRHNLALAYADAGRMGEAVREGERVLADRTRLLGPDHLDALVARRTLVLLFEQAGMTHAATAALARVLADQERLAGPDLGDTLGGAAGPSAPGSSRDTRWRWEHLVAGRERRAGQDQPDTFTIGLSRDTGSVRTGWLRPAVETGERLSAELVEAFGPEHPEALLARHNLANSYRWAGRAAEAVALGEEVLAVRERVLGTEHTDTLATRHNLAGSYRLAGRTAEAIALGEQVLEQRERLLGPDHPDTVTSRHNLAAAYAAAGRMTEAVRRVKEVLAARERLVGHDHPHAGSARKVLAVLLRRSGRPTEAIGVGRQVVEDRERLFGASHPRTLAARHELLLAYLAADRFAEAVVLGEQVVSGRARTLGPRHRDTLASRHHLGVAYRATGRLDDAVSLLERELGIRMQIQDRAHRHVVRARTALAEARTARARAMIPTDPEEALLAAGEVADRVAPYYADAPEEYGPVLAEAYRVAARALAAVGRAAEAAELRARAEGLRRGERPPGAEG
ncbi:tetratricopeptide repeat protein [Kitasatospora sp. NPDC004289]